MQCCIVRAGGCAYAIIDSERVLGAGKLYSPEDDTIAGLKAAHFISMATPHLGVAGQGDYRVSHCSCTCRAAHIYHLPPALPTAISLLMR